MKWNRPLIEATLLKRYKRFLADIQLGDEFFTAHVPNTGNMKACWEENWKCALSKSDNPARKMAHTLELTHNGETWIGVNTANANKLALEWLQENKIQELQGYTAIQPEKKVGDSRIDFYLDGHPTRPPCYVEVKSVTLKHQGVAQFPDSVSDRAQKHLKELMDLKGQGLRAAILYVVQREDVDSMSGENPIDKKYSELLKLAHAAGVEILVYQGKIGPEELSFKRKLPFHLESLC